MSLKLFGSYLLLIAFTCVQATPVLEFSKVEVDSEYSETSIFSIVEDLDGYIWFGTLDGLCLYDGYSFRIYQKNVLNTYAISENVVRSLEIDDSGYLWVGLQPGGVNQFDKHTAKFQQFNSDVQDLQGFESENAWEIYKDSKGDMWIGTWGSGLWRSTPDSAFETREAFKPFMLKNETVREIYEDSDGYVWVGTEDNGLYCIHSQSEEIQHFFNRPNDDLSLPHDSVLSILEDQAGGLWVGTNGGGLALFDSESKRIKGVYKEGDGTVTSILEISPGYLLVGTEQGLKMFDAERRVYIPVDDFLGESSYWLKDKLIHCIYQDKQGITWLGTDQGAFKQVIHKRFEPFAGLQINDKALCYYNVRSIQEDQDRSLWIGTLGKGLCWYSNKEHRWIHFNSKNSELKSDRVISVYADDENQIWVGTMNGYLQSFNRETRGFESFLLEEDPFWVPNMIQGITGNGDGYLWLATENGICRFHKPSQSWDFIRAQPDQPTALSHPKVQSSTMVFDDENNLWFGTFGGGLHRIKADQLYQANPVVDTWNHQRAPPFWINSENVISVDRSDDGMIWVGTHGSGVNYLNPYTGEVTVFGEDQGLSSKVIYTIKVDQQGRAWCGTPNGLNRINPFTGQIRVYRQKDGLVSSSFFWGAAHETDQGEMYFGGMNGFNKFEPSKIHDNKRVPKIIISDFEVFGKTRDIDVGPSFEWVILKPDENFFTIRFSSLDYIDPTQNKYRYKLSGIDKKWVDSGNRQTVSYTKVPAGKYEFAVIGSNNDGIWSDVPTTMSIIILPRYYDTLLFKLCLAASIFAFLYFVVRYRINLIKQKNELLEQHVLDRTYELHQANKELELHHDRLEGLVAERTEELERAKDRAEAADRLKSSFLANMSHEIRTPLNAIVGFSNLLYEPNHSDQEKMDFVEIINQNSDLLTVLVDDILDFSKIEAGQLVMNPQRFKLNDFISEIFKFLELECDKTELNAIFSHPHEDEHIELDVDRFRLKQILTNLLSNALKFTNSGSIELGFKFQNNEPVFYVKDSGIGISHELQSAVFDRFRKLDYSNSQLYRGSGLGLSISKGIIDLMNGRIELLSELYQGSTFSVFLPQECCFKDSVSTVSPVIKTELKNLNRDWSELSILIVEDELNNYLLLEQILRKTNAKIEWASDGVEAISFFQSGRVFDLVLMDIRMPRMDGYKALKRIRRFVPDQLVIAQTAYVKAEDLVCIQKAGFDEYISKPIKKNYLIELIDQMIENL